MSCQEPMLINYAKSSSNHNDSSATSAHHQSRRLEPSELMSLHHNEDDRSKQAGSMIGGGENAQYDNESSRLSCNDKMIRKRAMLRSLRLRVAKSSLAITTKTKTTCHHSKMAPSNINFKSKSVRRPNNWETRNHNNTRVVMTNSIFFYCLILLASQCTVALGLDCFVCTSRNGSNPLCEDPFHNLQPIRVTTPFIPDRYKPRVVYHAPCFTSRKNRDGLFPASACLKLAGTFENGETLMVRHCGLDSGTLTQDTEIVRMSHCGIFQLDGHHLRGCVMACSTDACNGSPSRVTINHPVTISLTIIGIVFSSLAKIGKNAIPSIRAS